MDDKLIYKEETYRIIGICMDVHNILGRGLSEIVYKDAVEYEFRVNEIPYTREKEFDVYYKDIILNHKFYADFVINDKIILEIKAADKLSPESKKQTLNYLGISRLKLGLLINFGEESLKYERIIL
jgi:GxxExxY protein